MSSLYRQAGSANWYAKIYIPGDPIPKRFSLKTADRKEAEQKLEEYTAKRKLGIPIDPQGDKVRFWQLCQLVVKNYESRGLKSLVHLKLRLRKHIIPALGVRFVSSISFDDIDDYIKDRRGAGAKDGTINRELTVIKRAFRLGSRKYPIRIPDIPKCQERNVRRGFFEVDQLEKVCLYLPDYLVPVVRFGWITGWRISEIRSLQWKNVDFAGEEVRLDISKNGDGRVFFMTKALRELLRGLYDQRTVASDYIFVRQVKTRDVVLKLGDFRKAWASACKKAGVSKALFHDLRRTAVRNLVRAGIQEKVAMDMTGHKTRSVFDRYNIVSTQDLKDAARKLDAAAGVPQA